MFMNRRILSYLSTIILGKFPDAGNIYRYRFSEFPNAINPDSSAIIYCQSSDGLNYEITFTDNDNEDEGTHDIIISINKYGLDGEFNESHEFDLINDAHLTEMYRVIVYFNSSLWESIKENVYKILRKIIAFLRLILKKFLRLIH